LPQALQKCAARIVPHDQQLEVASPGMISEELDLDSGFAINRFTTNAHRSRRRYPFARCEQGGAVVKNVELSRGRERPAPHLKR
jgi:hypothetical protein